MLTSVLVRNAPDILLSDAKLENTPLKIASPALLLAARGAANIPYRALNCGSVLVHPQMLDGL